MDKPFIVTARHEEIKRETARRLRRQMTPAEGALWQRLRASRLAGLHFRRQQIIEGFIVDFYCHAARLALEVDGAVHDRQVEYDAERAQVLQNLGLRLLRFSNDRVQTDLGSVLTEIALTARKPLPTK